MTFTFLRRSRRTTATVLGAAFTAFAVLSGCAREPAAPASADADQPTRRYDVIQAIASHRNTVVAGTQTGAVIVSEDGGAQWRRTDLGHASLLDIAACAHGSFIAIDYYHRLWFSDAGALRWQSVPLTQPETPIAVACDPSGGWWVSGVRSVISTSSDRGAHWQVKDFGKDIQLTGLQFIDAQRAIVVGEFGFTACSNDGGHQWPAGPRLPGEFYPYAVRFTSPNDGWVSGIAGQMLHTTDGGRTWYKQANPSGEALYRLFTVGGIPHGVGNGGALLHLDGGEWRSVSYPDAVPVFLGGGAPLADENAIVIGGPGGLLRKIALANR